MKCLVSKPKQNLGKLILSRIERCFSSFLLFTKMAFQRKNYHHKRASEKNVTDCQINVFANFR